jgi:hypothetical protein
VTTYTQAQLHRAITRFNPFWSANDEGTVMALDRAIIRAFVSGLPDDADMAILRQAHRDVNRGECVFRFAEEA